MFLTESSEKKGYISEKCIWWPWQCLIKNSYSISVVWPVRKKKLGEKKKNLDEGLLYMESSFVS